MKKERKGKRRVPTEEGRMPVLNISKRARAESGREEERKKFKVFELKFQKEVPRQMKISGFTPLPPPYTSPQPITLTLPLAGNHRALPDGHL